MELQHTHTFRVTMTRSHHGDSTYAHTSAKTNNIFDTKVAVGTELNTEKDAKIYNMCSTHTPKKPDITITSAAKLMQQTL